MGKSRKRRTKPEAVERKPDEEPKAALSELEEEERQFQEILQKMTKLADDLESEEKAGKIGS
ncbi:hypothetical protein QEH42_gp271 [Microbacterium phage Pumpernickel]|uniref:Uncharacterized protein n=1 Tax=Microbacterium phage Pumpernickel TaxID=2885983 RepID=A0AAE9C2X0_9CAUD|nr:hypothetical protein QEH42_gp271 [Microbacterium phage Pumpernickel]UDL15947.1 hypothetical protein SEA_PUMPERNICKEL_197 [Microbacterium phage Pumpernickel]